ncbi:MAG: alpha/beta fold hydrolase [Oscillospiraceae bacterium]|jgi:hypothetical protein
MKKYLSALLITAVFFTACSPQQQPSESSLAEPQTTISTTLQSPVINFEELAEKLSGQMATGDFEETVSLFSTEMASKISTDALISAWDNAVLPMGEFVGVYNVSKQDTDSTITAVIILEYEENGLSVSFSFGETGKIEGMWISYYDIQREPVSNEIYEEIPIVVGSGEAAVDGIMTIPVGLEKYPIAVLVHGSGPNDMDETIGANKPFRDIARALAEQGIATVRYNKRYYQHPELSVSATATISEEVLEDASAAIDLAAEHSESVFVIGHSLGGMLAPKIALDNPEIRGIISLAGSPRKLEDIIYDQQMAAASAQGFSEEQLSQLSQDVLAVNDLIKAAEENDDALYYGVAGSYWYSLNQINTPEIVGSLEIPMLFLQGGADFQIYPDKDFEEWKAILDGNENASFILYDDLNHIFMQTNGKIDTSEYETKGTVDDKVISDISKWIKSCA